MVSNELKRLNPQYTGKVELKDRDGRVVALTIPNADRVSDLGPVRVLKWLEEFRCTIAGEDGAWNASGELQDLTPLRGLLLIYLVISGFKVDDLSPLIGM